VKRERLKHKGLGEGVFEGVKGVRREIGDSVRLELELRIIREFLEETGRERGGEGGFMMSDRGN